MLVLVRKPGESILIGPDVRVEILRVKGESVRLGIHAPKSIQVDRDEIAKAKEKKS